eukprot:COSAG03_NODE_254_length_9907_cov_43.112765_7_plen_104_part_00
MDGEREGGRERALRVSANSASFSHMRLRTGEAPFYGVGSSNHINQVGTNNHIVAWQTLSPVPQSLAHTKLIIRCGAGRAFSRRTACIHSTGPRARSVSDSQTL